MHSYQRNLADSIQSLKRESSIYRFSHKSNTLCHRDRKKYYELVHKIVSLKRKHKLVTSILDSHVPVLRKDRNQGKYMESCPSDQNQSASRANKIVSTTAVDDGHFNYKIFLGTEIKSLTLRNKINEIKVRLETTLPDLVWGAIAQWCRSSRFNNCLLYRARYWLFSHLWGKFFLFGRYTC